jgi:hypothetical protein
MTTPRDERDSGRHRYADVPAGVSDYITAAIGGMGVELHTDSGMTVYFRESYAEADLHVVAEGPGGGYCWTREWSRQRAREYLRVQCKENPELRRGPVADVVPEEYRRGGGR